ncbi:ACT domain [Arabidopsis suecica]|uniref:ACT domain-containing protein ACR n=1 Tax=Arabidopsis suecica TaxID=45249 RepID=A0A8T1ZCB3_ARASU|nr:ACT domain [Arabidopsis suecica]
MQKVCWPYFDPDFDNLGERIYGPPCRVYIDNDSIQDCTVVKVNSENKQGLLLEVVQILTDMNLIITKSYISSDGGWFMDVFHVKDEYGNKLTDKSVINHIKHAIGTSRRESDFIKASEANNNPNNNSLEPPLSDHGEHTAIEMTGTDRPGLFSEIFAAFADLHCNVMEAHAWSHNARLACIAYVSDDNTHTPIDDPSRLASIEDHLSTVIRATSDPASNSTHVGHKENETDGFLAGQGKGCMNSNVERRLHQLMLSVRDFDEPFCEPSSLSLLSSKLEYCDQKERKTTIVSIGNCEERGYSIVTVKSKDRRRLMFDTICTLVDMQYVIFHAALRSDGADAFQEYFIRHIDGRALNTEGEKERVIKCLEAAIERRVCEGVKLEVCAENRVGLLSDITRVLRENGLTVVRADVETQGQKSLNAFYVRDISGNKIDMEFVESVKKEMRPIHLEVRNEDRTTDTVGSDETPPSAAPQPQPQPQRFSLGDILRSQIERLSLNFVPTK